MMKKTWKVWFTVLTMMSLSVTGIGCGSEEKKEETTNVSSEKEADTKTEVDDEIELELPWENGGKQPSEYTWKEYEELNEQQQIEFQKSFKDIVEFDAWLTQAQSNAALPWEDGGKQPSEYTWEEYESLSGFLQDAFFESFENPEDFSEWLEANEPQ